ncbi:MAG TPA: hypothetical protein VMG40_21430 [Bryobacteraceae bacterium]|nr:hypothetical protein [Bryobacteraceae bacterium]
MPDWTHLIRDRIASLHLTPAAEWDLTEELAQHLEDRYRELLAGGAAGLAMGIAACARCGRRCAGNSAGYARSATIAI